MLANQTALSSTLGVEICWQQLTIIGAVEPLSSITLVGVMTSVPVAAGGAEGSSWPRRRFETRTGGAPLSFSINR